LKKDSMGGIVRRAGYVGDRVMAVSFLLVMVVSLTAAVVIAVGLVLGLSKRGKRKAEGFPVLPVDRDPRA
jgi:hypothetical protein